MLRGSAADQALFSLPSRQTRFHFVLRNGFSFSTLKKGMPHTSEGR